MSTTATIAVSCSTCNAPFVLNEEYCDTKISLEQGVGRLYPDMPLPEFSVCLQCLRSMLHDVQTELAVLEQRTSHVRQFTRVHPGTEEYKKIEGLVQGLPIYRIEKNNNPKLYEEFTRATVGAETRLMFHGSRNDNYIKILTDGFDINKSRDGLLGVGVYFAGGPHYSYSFTSPLRVVDSSGASVANILNMLVCRVAITSGTRHGGGILCVPSDRHCYPEYIVYFRANP